MKNYTRIGLIIGLMLGISSSIQSYQENIPPGFGVIRGRVLDADGRPVPKAKVYAEPIDQPTSRPPVTYTDEEGRFFLNHVRPGNHMMHAVKEDEGYPDTYFAFFVTSPQSVPKITVKERTATRGIVIRLGTKSAKLVGRIVDAETGQPLVKANLTLYRKDDPATYFSTGPKHPYGDFHILVPPVPITIKVTALGYNDWLYRKDSDSAETGFLHLAPDATKELTISMKPIK